MPSTESPLSTAAVHILIGIGPGVRHGYAIMSEVVELTDGQVRLAPGTLYTNIKRLLNVGLIEEADPPRAVNPDDARRRYYRLTLAGRRVVADEVRRMSALVDRVGSWAARTSA